MAGNATAGDVVKTSSAPEISARTGVVLLAKPSIWISMSYFGPNFAGMKRMPASPLASTTPNRQDIRCAGRGCNAASHDFAASAKAPKMRLKRCNITRLTLALHPWFEKPACRGR